MVDNKRKYNHLKDEKSPYLIQHAQNPVDWYPWGEEAFRKAERENKPIFLSIGYSTCHWCHVMARESFMDPQLAKLINKVFVPIKVDREEHPDVDSTYMTACQIMTGSGGWPLNVFLTPDLKPFFAGTYFPPHSTELNVGLWEIILNIEKMWNQSKDELKKSAEQITHTLNQISHTKTGALLSESVLQHAFKSLKNSFNKQGGFGSHMQFPSQNILLFLLRYWERSGEERALEMVERTLNSMRMGGIWDHVGYGFHRYSVDPEWLVPHFEKMLYDQALLALVYLEAYQATGKTQFHRITEQILEYVLRDMTSKDGGFYSAEDAESEGVEGKFYLWTKEEIEDVLSLEESEIYCKIYQVKSEGNYLDETTQKYIGRNILHLKKPLKTMAEDMGLKPEDLTSKLENMRKKLFQAREKRIHPHKDDKILTDWNGLMIAALARAGRVLDREEYKEAAERAAGFIKNNLYLEGKLMHRYRDGEVKVEGYLDDYSLLIWGLLELYETTLDSTWLKWGLELNQILMDKFWDEEKGGFYQTSRDFNEILTRRKDVNDSVVPSGNSVSLINLQWLSSLLEDHKLQQRAIELEKAFAPQVNKTPTGHAMFLLGVMDRLGPFYEVVIAGEIEDDETQKLLEVLNKNYLPRVVFALNSNWLKEQVESYSEKIPLEGKVTAYICSQGECKLPTSDWDKLLELLSS